MIDRGIKSRRTRAFRWAILLIWLCLFVVRGFVLFVRSATIFFAKNTCGDRCQILFKARARIPPGLFMDLSLCGAWVFGMALSFFGERVCFIFVRSATIFVAKKRTCGDRCTNSIQDASAHTARPVYGFVSLWCVGFWSCDQILCKKPICGDRFQMPFISPKIERGASKMERCTLHVGRFQCNVPNGDQNA